MPPIDDSPRPPLLIERHFPEIDSIKDASLRAAVVAIWQELWAASPWTDIADVPASMETSYSNIRHDQAVMALVLAIADVFERTHGITVDRDCLIACAALQDASKLVEYAPTPDGGAKLTEIGHNYPHAFHVAHLAANHGLPAKIIHILLTHTPQSARFPEYLEGKILYYADQLDVIAIFKDRWKKETFITK